MKWTFVYLILSASLLFGNTGAAETLEDKARVQFDQGKDLFNKGRYEQAAIALRRAYELRPSYKILYYVGWAEVENESYTRALEAFEQFLKKGGDEVSSSRIKEVADEIEQLRLMVGEIHVECDEKGAIVMVDGERKGVTPGLSAIFVDLGKHEIQVKKKGRTLHEEVVRVAGGQRVIVDVQGSANRWSVSRADIKRKRIWTWVAFGVGGAAGIAAVVTGSLALSGAKDVDGQCSGDICPTDVETKAKKVEKMSWATDGLIGVAVVGAVAGTVLFFFEPELEADAQRVSLSPMVTSFGGGLRLSGRF